MDEPLRVLFIEDSALDAELEESALRDGGLSIQARRVETGEDLIRALRAFDPELVISDYSLPTMDGLTALKTVREVLPEVPFIFVSGTIGEERAIESLKNGATDYVVKERLGGLVVKVRRALREAEDRAKHRLLEEQLRQAQKMESIGRLAGGVAHDFNNLLTVIGGYTQLMLVRIPPGDDLRKDVEEVAKAGERAASLTSQLLAFSRKQIIAPAVLNLNDAISETRKLLGRLIGEDIELVTVLDPNLGNAKADPGQIEQVIMNLAVNARDAMPKGGKLALSTGNAVLDESYVKENPDSHAGPHVFLSVSDSGIGMDSETLSHLFEPFFTTKEQGKGTGLGLSTVFGIVKQSGGSIRVQSEPGHGTTFKVYLPRVDQPAAPARKAVASLAAAPKGTETVLLVEDEEAVRRLTHAVLRRNGYKVLVAGDGEEALRTLQQHQGPVHLLLTDVVLPRMGGREVALQVSQLRPEIRVLFTSGYSDRAFGENGTLEPGMAFLPKPFTPEELLRNVREILETPSSAAST
jgi:signal transduction histidine kinase